MMCRKNSSVMDMAMAMDMDMGMGQQKKSKAILREFLIRG